MALCGDVCANADTGLTAHRFLVRKRGELSLEKDTLRDAAVEVDGVGRIALVPERNGMFRRMKGGGDGGKDDGSGGEPANSTPDNEGDGVG